jgi:hypothetical protein
VPLPSLALPALVASNLTDMKGGDRDSVGFFQMRVGIWNQGKYAGYPDSRSSSWSGSSTRRWPPGRSVRRRGSTARTRASGEYRGRYQLRLDEARQLLGS